MPLALTASQAAAATTSALVVRVADPAGAPLGGAEVSIASPSLIGGPRRATTDGGGGARFVLLPVGTYTVTAHRTGFTPAAAEVPVTLDRTAAASFRLQPLAFTGSIDVGGDIPVVDTTQVSTGVVVGSSYLARATVGVDRRSYLELTRLAPGAVGQYVFGGTAGDNAYLIDGLNTTDPADGGWGTLLPFDAIQELSLTTGGFEAELGLATGGVLNLVTKSGGNTVNGALDARYRDPRWVEGGDRYDHREQQLGGHVLSVTLGGPLVVDRLWYFAAVERLDDSLQYAEEQFPRETRQTSWLAKLTWQLAASHRLTLRWSQDPTDDVGINASDTVEPSASMAVDAGGPTVSAGLSSVLGDSLLLDVLAGSFSSRWHPYPSGGGIGRPAHTSEDTDVQSHSGGLVWSDDRRRSDLELAATWFTDGRAGSHELRAGLAASHQHYEYALWYTGGLWCHDMVEPPGRDFVDLNGDGYFNHWVEVVEPRASAREPRTQHAEVRSTFLQDAWRPHPAVTVKPGLRLDAARHLNHAGDAVDDLHRLQPRLGIAWDLGGEAHHVLRLAAGRFMDPSALSLASFTSYDRVLREYSTLEYYCNLASICSPDDPRLRAFGAPISFTSDEGVEYVLFDNRTAETGAWTTVDQLGVGRLVAPYADQLVLAYETRLAPGTSLELSWVDKRTERLIEDTCIGNAWVWGAAPAPSLDDPSTWTSSGDCGSMVLANIPDLRRRYRAAIARLDARTDRFHLLASYTWSTSRTNTDAGPEWYQYDTADYFPVGFVNRWGYAPDHRPHRVRVNGYLLLPRNVTLGLDAFWSSAGHQTVSAECGDVTTALLNPNGRAQLDGAGLDPVLADYCTTSDGLFLDTQTLHLTPRGGFATKSVWQVDLQGSKTFSVGRTDLTVIVTVVNLFDRELERTFSTQASQQDTGDDGRPLFDAAGDPVYVPLGQPLTYWLPRRYELAVRLEF